MTKFKPKDLVVYQGDPRTIYEIIKPVDAYYGQAYIAKHNSRNPNIFGLELSNTIHERFLRKATDEDIMDVLAIVLKKELIQNFTEEI